MNLKTILALLCPLLVVSCGKESPAIHQEGQDDREVSFFGSIGPQTRATDSDFEAGDAIGVFAIEKTSSNPNGDIQTSNHADNVKYSYSNGSFKGASTVIKQITFQRLMFYKAVYPYTSSARNEFTFSVKTNQSYGDYYTLSDLMTAEAGPTSGVTPKLTFTHRLCDVLVSVCYEERPTGTAHLYFNNVKTSVKVNLNEDTFVTGNAAGNVKAKPYGTNGFRLVLPPQVINKGVKLITLNIGSSSYSVTTDEYITLRPEIQHTFRLVVRKDGKATLTTSENPWKSDIGIEDIVPKEMLRGIKEHMPIYVGNTPPDVEGSYYINPYVSAYYSDLDKNPENSLTSETINFSDQIDGTLTVNTLTDGSDTYYYLEGAYITGATTSLYFMITSALWTRRTELRFLSEESKSTQGKRLVPESRICIMPMRLSKKVTIHTVNIWRKAPIVYSKTRMAYLKKAAGRPLPHPLLLKRKPIYSIHGKEWNQEC